MINKRVVEVKGCRYEVLRDVRSSVNDDVVYLGSLVSSQSASHGYRWVETYIWPDGDIIWACECPAWQVRRRCAHIEAVQAAADPRRWVEEEPQVRVYARGMAE